MERQEHWVESDDEEVNPPQKAFCIHFQDRVLAFFTLCPVKREGHIRVIHFQDNPEDISTIDSCEYIWESGVGFAHSPPQNSIHDQNRTELLKLCLTCFSETMYLPPVGELAFRGTVTPDNADNNEIFWLWLQNNLLYYSMLLLPFLNFPFCLNF